MDEKARGLSTKALYGGEEKLSVWGTTNPPIFQSAAFAFPDLETWHKTVLKEAKGHIYSRNSNPTVEMLERKVSVLEDGEACAAFASGMAAITAISLAFLKPGDRLVSVRDLYGGTYLLFSELLPKWGVDVCLVSSDEENLLDALKQGTRLVFMETPSNPMLKILDIGKIAAEARSVGAMLLVDSTLATPFNQLPLASGANLVVHSATKFLSGHGDVMAGAVIGSQHLIDEVFRTRELTGACMDAHAAWLLIRGLKTLAVWMACHNQNALAVARFLEQHAKVRQVLYPGLEGHPNHEVASRQMKGFGGVVSFEVEGGPVWERPWVTRGSSPGRRRSPMWFGICRLYGPRTYPC